MKKNSVPSNMTRRDALAGTGLVAASLFIEPGKSQTATAVVPPADEIARTVAQTPFVDTHEHLIEEDRRTHWEKPSRRVPCNDWALLFSHYLNSDLKVAGMSAADHDRFLSADFPPARNGVCSRRTGRR